MAYADEQNTDARKAAGGIVSLILLVLLVYWLFFSEASMGQDQYDRISNGMTMEEVVQIAGGEGHRTTSMEGPVQMDMYEWRGPGLATRVSIDFVNGRVMAKSMVSM